MFRLVIDNIFNKRNYFIVSLVRTYTAFSSVIQLSTYVSNNSTQPEIKDTNKSQKFKIYQLYF